jgi:soluble lytic murein transglycosylase-like protein
MDARLLAILMQSRMLPSQRFNGNHSAFTGAATNFSTLLHGLMTPPAQRLNGRASGSVEAGANVSQPLPLATRHVRLPGGYVPPLGTPYTAAQSRFDTPGELHKLIHKTAAQYNVDPALVTAVVCQESGFNPHATSRVGAAGLMQLMPATARELGVTNVYDPRQNIDGGVRYLKEMLERYNGDVKLALAAYNAGPGNVDRYGGVPPFSETQLYVKNILASIGRA